MMGQRMVWTRYVLPTLARLCLLGAALSPAWAWQQPSSDPPAVSPSQAQFFETKIRPILADNCWKCHGEQKHKGELRLDSRSALLAGGDSGAAIVPGHPEKSLLVKAIGYT